MYLVRNSCTWHKDFHGPKPLVDLRCQRPHWSNKEALHVHTWSWKIFAKHMRNKWMDKHEAHLLVWQRTRVTKQRNKGTWFGSLLQDKDLPLDVLKLFEKILSFGQRRSHVEDYKAMQSIVAKNQLTVMHQWSNDNALFNKGQWVIKSTWLCSLLQRHPTCMQVVKDSQK